MIFPEKHPDIHIFNPTCEYAVANGNESWMPNKILQRMEKDLSLLPWFLTREKDVIISDLVLRDEFHRSMAQLGLHIPLILNKKDALKDQIFVSEPKNRLEPWGWSPAMHKLLHPLKQACSSEFKQSPVFQWSPGYRTYYSKRFGLEILKNILEKSGNENYLPWSQLPQVCNSNLCIEKLISKWGKVMVKSPWSSSGRGLQPITKTPVHPKVWEKTGGMIADQGFVIVEPFLDKVHDIAFQFEVQNGRLSFIGMSHFSTDKKGQYTGNFLKGLPDSFPENVRSFSNTMAGHIVPALLRSIESSPLTSNYEGFIGVDALVYRDRQKRLKINPCLEINVRKNMGLLSLQLEKIISSNRKGVFRTYFLPGKKYDSFRKEMEFKYPLKIINGNIESGFLSLTSPDEESVFGAYMLV